KPQPLHRQLLLQAQALAHVQQVPPVQLVLLVLLVPRVQPALQAQVVLRVLPVQQLQPVLQAQVVLRVLPVQQLQPVLPVQQLQPVLPVQQLQPVLPVQQLQQVSATTTALSPQSCTAGSPTMLLNLYNPGSFSYTYYSYSYTPTTQQATIMFELQQDPSSIYIDAVSVVNASSQQLLTNGGFETGSLSPWQHGTISGGSVGSTDSGPHCVAVGDFNNDSRVDIAVVNHYNNFIGIFEEFGYGTFGNEMIYPTESGSLSRSLVVADFNDDKLLDLAVANSGASSAGVFFGYCCDPFRNQSTYDTGNNSHPSSVAVGDPNNDNQSDIVVANYGTNNIVDLGEFNGDRWLDIAVAIHGTNYTAVLLESGDGSFAKQTFHWIGNIALTPAAVVGDFNSDKQLNIILSNDASNNIGILYGYGNGTFETLNLCSIGYNSRPYSLGMSDLNSDTQLDIVIANRLKNNI
ncbi:unnamed protein product, partial [Rotaria socialis]